MVLERLKDCVMAFRPRHLQSRAQRATKAKHTQHVYQTSNGYVKISEHEIWYKMISSHELHGFHIFMQMKCCLGTLSASVQAAPQ